MQTILVKHLIKSADKNPSEDNCIHTLKQYLFTRKDLYLDQLLLILLEKIFEITETAGVLLFSQNLNKLKMDLKNVHLTEELCDLLTKYEQKTTVSRLLKWNIKLVENRRLLEKFNYAHSLEGENSTSTFVEILNYLIQRKQTYELDFFVENALLNCPEKIEEMAAILSTYRLKLRIADTICHLLDNQIETERVYKIIQFIGQSVIESSTLFKTLLYHTLNKVHIAKQYLSALNLKSSIDEHIQVLAGLIGDNNIKDFYDYLNEIYSYTYISSRVIVDLLLNKNVKLENVFFHIPSQSVFNSFLNSTNKLTSSINDVSLVLQVMYFIINNNFYKTCFNTECMDNFIYAVTSLVSTIDTDDIKLKIIYFTDLTKFKVSSRLYDSITPNLISEEKALSILEKLETIGYSKVDSSKFVTTLISSLSQKQMSKYILKKLFNFLEGNRYNFSKLMESFIENNLNNFAYWFVKNRKKLLRKDYISQYSEKELVKKAWKKLTIWKKILCFFHY